MAMDISRLLNPEVQAHPILTETYRTIPRVEPRPSTPGIITITNIFINPVGRVSPRFHQKEHRAGYMPRQLIINSRNYPVQLTQANNESAVATSPQPKVEAVYFLPKGLRTVTANTATQIADFTSLTTGYYYPETDICICSEPYHDQTKAPHGPSYRCVQCVTRLPFVPPPSSSSSSVRLGHLLEPGIPVTSDNQTLPAALCTKCISLTTNTLRLDYPLAFQLPTQTAPMCHHCSMTYIRVRKDGAPDPTGPLSLFSPCQCHVWLRHLFEGRVCYMCKLSECQRRTGLVETDRKLHAGIVGHGLAKGTLDLGYLCRCGERILGEQDFDKRGVARCVVCERVVARESFRDAFGPGV
ncbi:hypothetical protein GJ744_012328 [Endocarpon pusillum]|uniref:Uncharacterized protein n=1 Tax=Endocarpon pusillum TaxID=364733 RepID=A0A8H7AF46_9EURO|nr:hypothetical protein GJ744_012328 [Endocarpon pusillum]